MRRSLFILLLSALVIADINVAFDNQPVDTDESRLYRPYEVVHINDPAEKSAGIYFRISQRGVDYLAGLMSEGLPLIFHRMMLPSIEDSGFSIKDAVITRITRPEISVKFVEGYGIDLSIRLPELEIRGNAKLDVMILSYESQVVAVSNNMTVNMKVAIRRLLNETLTNVTVTDCSVDPGPLKLSYFGGDAAEFYTINAMINDGIDKAIRDKVCLLPPLLRDFIREKIDLLMSPPKAENEVSSLENGESVLDHLCGQPKIERKPSESIAYEDDDPDVNLNTARGSWVPDLTLRYPPTFSEKDLIFGIDGGVLVDGSPTSAQIDRPRLDNLTVLRDQMLGLILSEYVPNTLFQQIYDQKVGAVSVVYSLRHIPRIFRPLGKIVCSDCKLLITANLTKVPISTVNRNGIQLNLEGDVSALFFRKNVTHNVLTANGVIRVNIKPHFRHSRLFSDILLAGIDFKVHKAGVSGLMSGVVRKIVSFMVPRAIWPKIQQRLRLAISYKGIRIPRFCTMELRNLHLDYVNHGAVLSTDFDVDLPLLVRSFKDFLDSEMRHSNTLDEYRETFRYL